MSVVEFENIGADRVEKRSRKRVRSFATADDSRVWRAEEKSQPPYRQLHRLVPAAPQSSADEIQNRPLGLVSNLVRNILPLRVDKEFCQASCDIVRHGLSLTARNRPQ